MAMEATSRAEQISAYTNNTRISARHAVALGLQLQQAAPADLSAAERALLEEMLARSRDVRDVQERRDREAPTALRESRNAVSVAWTSVYGGLTAVASIPAELGSEGAEAQALIELVFPDGTAFTKLDGAGLWDRTDSMLARIVAMDLQARIDALINPRLLASVRTAFERLSRGIKVTGTVSPSVPKNALTEANARFSFAVARYARALSLRVGDDDDAAFAVFLSAVAPIDAMRIQPGASEEDEDELDVAAPVTPPVARPIDPGMPGADPFVRS